VASELQAFLAYITENRLLDGRESVVHNSAKSQTRTGDMPTRLTEIGVEYKPTGQPGLRLMGLNLEKLQASESQPPPKKSLGESEPSSLCFPKS